MRQILTKRSLLGAGVLMVPLALMFFPVGSPAAASTNSVAATAPPTRALPVKLEEVTRVQGWQESTRFTGTVTARRVSALGFERGGRLLEVLVDTGELVEQGQVLARLDAERFERQRIEAVAALAVEQARLDEAIAGPRAQSLLQARAEVDRWEAEVARLEREAERRAELLANGVSAEEEAESLAFSAQAARAGREAARQQLAELEAGTRKEQVLAQRAARDLAAAKLAQLELEIERSALLAPFAGTVLDRSLDEGVVLSAGAPILQLQERSALEAHIGVPVEVAASLEIGTSFALQLGSEQAQGRLRAALPNVDRFTRSRTLVFDLDHPRSLPGVTAAWSTTVHHEGEGHAVPATALIPSRRGLWAVYLYSDEDEGQGELTRQEVTILHAESDVVIVAGLQDGDQVVAAGTDRVVPGQLVRPQTD